MDAIAEAFDPGLTTDLSRFDEMPSNWGVDNEKIQYCKIPIKFDDGIEIGYNCGSAKAGSYRPKWNVYEFV